MERMCAAIMENKSKKYYEYIWFLMKTTGERHRSHKWTNHSAWGGNGNDHFLAYIPCIMMEKSAPAGEGGGARPPPFHYIYHHVQS
jgi:hypothetical protein